MAKTKEPVKTVNVTKQHIISLRKRLELVDREYGKGNDNIKVLDEFINLWDELTECVKVYSGYDTSKILELYSKDTIELLNNCREAVSLVSKKRGDHGFYSCVCMDYRIAEVHGTESPGNTVLIYTRCVDMGDKTKDTVIEILKRAFVWAVDKIVSSDIKKLGTESGSIGVLAFQWKLFLENQGYKHFLKTFNLSENGWNIVSSKETSNSNYKSLLPTIKSGSLCELLPGNSSMESVMGDRLFLNLESPFKNYYSALKFTIDSVVNLTSVKGVTASLIYIGEGKVKAYIYTPSIEKLLANLLDKYPLIIAMMLYVSHNESLIIHSPDMCEFINGRTMTSIEITTKIDGIFKCHCGSKAQDFNLKNIWRLIQETNKTEKEAWLNALRAWIMASQFHNYMMSYYSSKCDCVFIDE